MSQGKINVYVCQKCRGRTVTIDTDDGTTPFMIKCRSAGGCHEAMAESSFYRVNQNLIPTYEWYRPVGEELAALEGEMKEHVDKGGLCLRRISALSRNYRLKR